MFEGLFQPMHLVVIVGLALLMFGPKRLPELGKGIGDGIQQLQISHERPRQCRGREPDGG